MRTRATWRVQIVRQDGTIRHEFTAPTREPVNNVYENVVLYPGEKALYQIKHPGKFRFETHAVRT